MEEQFEEKRPRIRDVNILYLIAMILLIFGGEVVQRAIPHPENMSYEGKMLLVVLVQVLLVFLPTALFIYFKKLDVKYLLRLNKISFVNVILTVAIMLFTIPVEAFFNIIVVIILKQIGRLHEAASFPSDNLYQLAINFFVIAIIPPIFEETLFRGVIMRGYERIGKTGSIVVTAALFGLLHRDIQGFLGTFILGIVISYLVYRTNSIFAGMIAHLTNNGFIVLMTFGLMKMQNLMEKYSPQISDQINKQQQNVNSIAAVTNQQLLLGLFIFAILAVVFGIWLAGLIFLIRYTTRNIQRESRVSESEERERFAFVPLIVSFVLVLYVYLGQLGVY